MIFDVGNHVNTNLVASALKFGREESVNEVTRKSVAYNSCAKAKYICIVVGACHARGEGVRAASGSYSLVLVCNHAHANTCAAYENTAGSFVSTLYALGNCTAVDGVVA